MSDLKAPAWSPYPISDSDIRDAGRSDAEKADAALLAWSGKHLNDLANDGLRDGLPVGSPQIVPFDPEAEKAAYAELIAAFEANPEPDCEITFLSLDDFCNPQNATKPSNPVKE